MIKDIIEKKKDGKELTIEEINYFFNGYLNGEIEDYQMSALLMAICLNGMSQNEVMTLTEVFINSGKIVDLSMVDGVVVDKHSTGGVGDKTTLIVVPMVASCGVKVVKMSGRGLGYTGGTIDKLSSLPGININLTKDEIIKQVNEINAVITSPSENICPLDKKIYALRDVTATTNSIPLIAVSIMSKKIASGANKILLDIKIGSGAFMKTKEEATLLADTMVAIGKKYNKEVRCILSDMNTPLGNAIGNSLEVLEAFSILQAKEKNSLYNLCVELASEMVSMGKNISFDEAKKQVEHNVDTLAAYNKLLQIIKYQHGHINGMPISENVMPIVATKSGIVSKIDALEIAKLAFKLGAGRSKKEDSIDLGVGVYLNCKEKMRVEIGDTLAYLYKKTEDKNSYDIEGLFNIR